MSGPGERHVWKPVEARRIALVIIGGRIPRDAEIEACACGAMRMEAESDSGKPIKLFSEDAGRRWSRANPPHAELMARKEAAHG